MIHRIQRPSRPEFRPGAYGVRAVLFALVLGPWAFSLYSRGHATGRARAIRRPSPLLKEGPYLQAYGGRGLPLCRRPGLLWRREHRSRRPETAALGHHPALPGAHRARVRPLRSWPRPPWGWTNLRRGGRRAVLGLFESRSPDFPEAAFSCQPRPFGPNGEPFEALQALSPDPHRRAPRGHNPGPWSFFGSRGSMSAPQSSRSLAEVDAPMAHPFQGLMATELAVSLFLEGIPRKPRIGQKRP